MSVLPYFYHNRFRRLHNLPCFYKYKIPWKFYLKCLTKVNNMSIYIKYKSDYLFDRVLDNWRYGQCCEQPPSYVGKEFKKWLAGYACQWSHNAGCRKPSEARKKESESGPRGSPEAIGTNARNVMMLRLLDNTKRILLSKSEPRS